MDLEYIYVVVVRLLTEMDVNWRNLRNCREYCDYFSHGEFQNERYQPDCRAVALRILVSV